jgi:hypothetical protein
VIYVGTAEGVARMRIVEGLLLLELLLLLQLELLLLV